MLPLASLALVLAAVLAVGAYAVARVDALDHRAVLVVVAVGLAVGGVAAQSAPPAPVEVTTTVASDPVPNATTPAASDDSRTVAERHGETDAVAAANASATVVGVAGGGRLTYRTAAGERRTVRLAGIDALGADGGDPERFDGVVTGSYGRTCLAEAGRRALIDARTALVGESVTVRSVTGSAGAPTAVLAVDGRSLNRRFVERGYARATDDRYADAERAARSAERGVWSCATVEPTPPLRESAEPALRIAAVHPNPPGDDAAALADEYVVVENAGEKSVDLSNWYLTDGGDRTYFFFDGRTLRPGEQLVVHVGDGRNRDGHVYWGASAPVLDNDHETLKLVDGDTDRVTRLSY
jgi:micrococcal nuclease